MGNGFKRFTDLSPLSLKNLNDQIEKLWFKVMGGITYQDMDGTTQSIIDGKTDEDKVTSMIQQSRDEILLAVGSGGGDNLISNGNWEFGTESWNYNSGAIIGGYMRINTSSLTQTGIRAEGNRTYTFGLEGYGNTQSKAYVFCQYSSAGTGQTKVAEITLASSGSVRRYRTSFTTPASVVSLSVKVETTGTYYVKRLFIREGDKVDEYTSNPNEITGSGLSITENEVSISTPSFTLGLLNDEGQVTSVLSTDGTGFDDLRCTNLTIIDRKFVGEAGTQIYVNSATGLDSNSGESTYYPFKTIARALKAVPLHIKGSCTIHLSGGTYNENISFNYGGTGSITISGGSAVLNGHISFSGTSYNVKVENLHIFSRSTYCVYGHGNNCFVELSQCLMDCNGNAAANGIYMTNGFRMYINNCEINNCNYGIYCTRGSHLDLVDCKGDGNTVSVVVNDMAVINAEGTVPMGDTINRELNGGRIDGYIIAGIVGEEYVSPRADIASATFRASAKFTYNGSTMQSGILKQGKGNGAFLVFDTASVTSTLAGKTIKSVKLSVKRRGNDINAHTGILKAFSHNVASASGSFSYGTGYGDVGTVNRGEEVSVDIPPAIIGQMIAGTAKGILFYDNSGSKSYTFELDSSYASRLEVLYV